MYRDSGLTVQGQWVKCKGTLEISQTNRLYSEE